MAHESGQPMELALRVEALAIPAEQAADRERMTEAVQRRRRGSVGDGEVEGRDEVVEGRAGGARVDAALPVEGEQRSVRPGPAALPAAPGMVPDQDGDPRPGRDEPALAELAAAHDEQLPAGVDVAKAQPACLAGSQSEPVTQGQDAAGRRAP